MSNGKKYRPKSAIKLELGAYVLSTEIRNGRDYLVLRNVPNGWRVEWRDDSHVYSLLLSVLLERGEGLEEYLSHWFAMIFMASTIFPDVPMVAGYFKLVEQYAKRHEEHKDELTDMEMREQIALAYAAVDSTSEKFDEMMKAAEDEIRRNTEVKKSEDVPEVAE